MLFGRDNDESTPAPKWGCDHQVFAMNRSMTSDRFFGTRIPDFQKNISGMKEPGPNPCLNAATASQNDGHDNAVFRLKDVA